MNRQAPSIHLMRKSVAYITGEVKLEFEPPHGFTIEPSVEVDGVLAHFSPIEGGSTTVWIYLALVEGGTHQIEVTLGNVVADQEVSVSHGQVAHVDFIFAKEA